MKSDILIENFGNIENIALQVDNLTVLSGRNNSGKSFILKLLYAFFSTIKTFGAEERPDFVSQLKDTFRVLDEKQLIKEGSDCFSVTIDRLAKFRLEGNGSTTSSVTYRCAKVLNNPSSPVVYIESPIYWRLADVLDRNRINTHNSFGNGSYSGCLPDAPGYFYDLLDSLKLNSIDRFTEFGDVSDEITQTIGGRIIYQERRGLVFQVKEGNAYPLSTTAAGVISLGILASLLDKGVITKGSFLFIDDPEGNLNPNWQVALSGWLYKLANRGVIVVIATHSVDILKGIEVLVKRDPGTKHAIALNLISPNGCGCSTETGFEEKLEAIKQDLLEPFYNLYLGGL